MSDGRSYWLALDAGWWDRALVVELTMSHGPLGPAALLWLMCHAKAQNDGGRVKSGWASVARGIGSDRGAVTSAIAEAASLGLLDEFEELDGHRFTCRISGWQGDQDRALGAARQARYRDRHAALPTVTSDETVTRTGQDRKENDANASSSDGEGDERQDVAYLCDQLAARMVANDPKAKVGPERTAWRQPMRRLLDIDQRPADEVLAVIAWCQVDAFWQSNILSPAKLREKFPTLLAQMKRPPQTVRGAPRNVDRDKLAAAAAAYEARHAQEATTDE